MLWSNGCKVHGKISSHILKKSPIALTYSRIIEGATESKRSFMLLTSKKRRIRHSNYVSDTCVPGEFLPRLLPLCECYAYFQTSGPKKAEAIASGQSCTGPVIKPEDTNCSQCQPSARYICTAGVTENGYVSTLPVVRILEEGFIGNWELGARWDDNTFAFDVCQSIIGEVIYQNYVLYEMVWHNYLKEPQST